jgi:hypothetical protein
LDARPLHITHQPTHRFGDASNRTRTRGAAQSALLSWGRRSAENLAFKKTELR